MSHVFILTATKHRVPRWFTEGLAVHEETQASPEWGDRLTPDVVVAHQGQEAAAGRASSIAASSIRVSRQVIVSYFQAGRICDYIKENWGDDKLLDMVHAFAELQDRRRR